MAGQKRTLKLTRKEFPHKTVKTLNLYMFCTILYVFPTGYPMSLSRVI